MLRSVFFRRLFLPYLLLIVLAIAGVGLFAASRLRAINEADHREDLRDNLQLVQRLIQPHIDAARMPELNEQVRALGAAIEKRITLVAADGAVIADSWVDPATMANHIGRAEIAASIAQGEAFRIRPSDSVNEPMLYMARRIEIAGRPPYYLRLAVPLRDLRRELSLLYLTLGGVALATILAAALVSYRLARRQAQPVVELTELADRIAQGQLDRRTFLGRHGPGEIGTLGAALNKMASAISGLLHQAERGRAELLAILASMHEGVIATDLQQHVLVVNAAAGQLLGFDHSQACGKPLWQVARLDRMIKASNDVLDRGGQQRIEVAMPAGRHLEVCLVPYPSNPPHQGLVVVVHDATQSVRYQELRKEFVANVSHELRTPLTVIKGYVETLREGAMDDPAKSREYLATIERHANQLTNLVNDLLELSRLESQPDLPVRTNVNVALAARKVVDLLLPAAQRKGQSLMLDAQPVALVPGNPDYIERAIANLVDNAIKYTPDNGSIHVRVFQENGAACVEVADNGIGVPPEDVPRIFERFYRVDRSRSREMGGTGLGLSIVKHVVLAHGGAVEVDSAVGKGSTFRIRLPLPQPAAVPA